VDARGLASNNFRWVPSSKNYLFPVEVMGALLRGKMITSLRALHARGVFASFTDFKDPEAFHCLMSRLARTNWVVYAKKPFREVDHVLKYLGRYTHRVGISNSRLVHLDNDAVTFRTKNGKTVTVTPVEFLRRFVQHVLPDRFHKIRHYGLYAGATQDARLVARQLLEPVSSSVCAPSATPLLWSQQLHKLTGRDVHRCPCCGEHLEHRPVPPTRCRAPPPALEVAA
jgi:hypothetical protein